jgi:cyclopropane-fatty-acyl-phospholipid synthase
MSDASVRAISLPQIRTSELGTNMAKHAFFQILGQLKLGSLTLHDGAEVLHFGSASEGRELHAEVRVHDPVVYRQVLLGGAVGSGESFMQGAWSSPDLTKVVQLFTANMSVLQSMDARKSWRRRLGLAIAHALNNNTLRGSRRNISAHYDLGNEFFELFLDPSMMYSSAVFPERHASLEEASEHKLDLICQQLQLSSDDHLLEIGTGWGGMAIHAASRFGCKVTTTTISREQYEYACRRVKEAGLQEQITVLCEDYRDLKGHYDKLVSVEMIEAVGHQFYQNYFQKCSSLLKPEGLMVIQAITMVDQRYEQARDRICR